MTLLPEVTSRLRSLFSLLTGRPEDRDLAEEIRFHIEKETEKNLTAGAIGDALRRIQRGGS